LGFGIDRGKHNDRRGHKSSDLTADLQAGPVVDQQVNQHEIRVPRMQPTKCLPAICRGSGVVSLELQSPHECVSKRAPIFYEQHPAFGLGVAVVRKGRVK